MSKEFFMPADDIDCDFASPIERLATYLNALTPERRALLRAIYLPAQGYAVEELYQKAPHALLRTPLDIPVIKYSWLTEPLVNLDGHVLVPRQLSTFEFE